MSVAHPLGISLSSSAGQAAAQESLMATPSTTRLQQLEAQALKRYLSSYEDFVRRQEDQHVERSGWDFVRQQDGVRAYAKRRNVRMKPMHSDDAGLLLPALLMVGSVQGSVADVLHGILWLTSDQRHLRSHFTRDGIADATVLQVLERPTTVRPFRSLAVKWVRKRAPTGSSMLIKDRDFCFLGSTGTVVDSQGERIGYELRHSVPYVDCPRTQTAVRAHLYFCTFFRQMKNGRLQIYHQGCYDAAGDLMQAVAAKAAIDSFIRFTKLQECSFAKKLARAIHDHSAPSFESSRFMAPNDGASHCGVCYNVLSRDNGKRACAVCRQVVCSSCSVRKEVMPVQGSKPVSRCVCRACVMTVLREDAKAVAIREINDPQTGNLPHPESSPSASLQRSGLFNPMSSVSTFNGARSLLMSSRVQRSMDMESGSRFVESRLLGDEARRRSTTPRAPRERVAQANRAIELVKERRKDDIVLRSERDTRQWDLSSSRVRSPQKTDTISSRSPPDTVAHAQRRRRQTVGASLEAAHHPKNEMWLGDLLLTLCPSSSAAEEASEHQQMRRRPHSKRQLVQRRRSFSLNSMEHTRLHHRHPIGAIQELRYG